MPDDHGAVEPLLPIPNRTVKRCSADDSEHSFVKVGHCQAVIKSKTPGRETGGFLLCAVCASVAANVQADQCAVIRLYFKFAALTSDPLRDCRNQEIGRGMLPKIIAMISVFFAWNVACFKVKRWLASRFGCGCRCDSSTIGYSVSRRPLKTATR